MKIAYFGTGLLGAGFVRRLLEHGHSVNVWNRSAAKAKALEADGAVAFDDPAAAVAGVEMLHLTLSDDASVDSTLDPIAASIASSTWIVDHTTTAPTPTRERIARWQAQGHHFVHAPVFMGPQNTRDGTGTMLISGARSDYDHLRAHLETMTGTLRYLGSDPARAAGFKLLGNLMILTLNAGLADVNALARASGISTADAMGLFDSFNPGAALPMRAKRVSDASFEPGWEITMARKDARLMIEEAGRGGVRLAVMPAVAALYDAAIARGDGALDSTAVARA